MEDKYWLILIYSFRQPTTMSDLCDTLATQNARSGWGCCC